jgi:CHRD domain-containing protein
MNRSIARLLMVAAVAGCTTVLALSCGGGSSTDRLFATLNGAQETPPNSSTGTGQAFYRIPDNDSEIKFQLQISGLQNVILAHIHYGPPGVSGPIIFNLATSSFTEVSGNLTAADFIPDAADGLNTFQEAIAAIKAGNTYTNVHTTQFPLGEIRGQIIEK